MIHVKLLVAPLYAPNFELLDILKICFIISIGVHVSIICIIVGLSLRSFWRITNVLFALLMWPRH